MNNISTHKSLIRDLNHVDAITSDDDAITTKDYTNQSHQQTYEPYSYVDDGSVVLLAFLVALLIALTIVLALTYYCVCKAIRTWKSGATSDESDSNSIDHASSSRDSSNDTYASAQSHLTPLIQQSLARQQY